jgi:hypothetical protein
MLPVLFNNHDLERFLSHYADSAELTSLLVTKILAIRTGRSEVSARCAAISRRHSRQRLTSKFELLDVVTDVDSVAPFSWFRAVHWRCSGFSATLLTGEAAVRGPRCGFREGT